MQLTRWQPVYEYNLPPVIPLIQKSIEPAFGYKCLRGLDNGVDCFKKATGLDIHEEGSYFQG